MSVPGQQASGGRGGSRTPKTHAGATTCTGGCASQSYDLFAVNPNTDQVEGDESYPDLRSIPGGVEERVVVIGTRPEIPDESMRRCTRTGSSMS